MLLLSCIIVLVYSNLGSCVYLDHNIQYQDLIINVKGPVEDKDFFNNLEDVMQTFGNLLQRESNLTIDKVIVIIPENLQLDEFIDNRTAEDLTDQNYIKTASIIIKPSNSTDEVRATTLHLGSCGQPGEYIDINSQLITSSSLTSEQKGLIHLHEWGHYRWGVFDEYGITGETNSIRPFYLNENRKIQATGCPSVLKGWILKRNTSCSRPECKFTKCKLQNSGYPEAACRFYADPEDSSTYRSVMMGYIAGKFEFCGKSDQVVHNSIAPNLHNLKCSGKTTWEVIKNHPDFQRPAPNNTVTKHKIKFNYLKQIKIVPGKEVKVFIFTKKMDSTLKDNIILALRRLKPSLVGMITLKYTREKNNTENMNFNRGAKEIWYIFPTNRLDYVAGLARDDKQIYCLVATNSSFREVKSNLSMLPPDQVFPFSIELSILEMAEVFRSALIKRALPSEQHPIVVYKKKFYEENYVIGSFVLNSTHNSCYFLLSDANLVSNFSGSLEPSCRREDSSECAKIINLENKDKISEELAIGKWTYNMSGLEPNSTAFVTVRCKLNDTKLIIIPQVFTSSRDENSYNASNNSGITLSTCVMRDGHPVSNAKVTSVVSLNGVEVEEITLYDDGVGFDGVKDDGIYTNEFQNFTTNGVYSFSFHVVANEESRIILHRQIIQYNENGETVYVQESSGGSNYPSPIMNQLRKEEAKFIREKMGKSQYEFDGQDMEIYENDRLKTVNKEKKTPGFDVEIDPVYIDVTGTLPQTTRQLKDWYNPGRVTDLVASELSYQRSSVTLEWTSAGDDSFTGTASEIILKYSQDRSFYPEKFHDQGNQIGKDNLNNFTLVPLEAREKHTCEVKVDKGNKTYPENDVYFFALVYVDDSGNHGMLSNLAVAYFKSEKHSKELRSLKVRKTSGRTILFLFFGFLVFTLIVIFAIRFFHKLRAKVNPSQGHILSHQSTN